MSFTVFKEWAEIIGNLSQALLCVLGGLVFWQIKIAKDDLKTRCKRDSRSASMDLVEKFAKEIVPLTNSYYAKGRSKSYKFEQLSLDNFYLNEVPEVDKKIYENSVNFFMADSDMYNDCVRLLNLLEAFAMNFTKGVADEEILFTAAAPIYCTFVARSFAVLCLMRSEDKFNLFDNTVELYKLWSDRIKIKGLSLQKEGIMEQLKKMPNKKITPIGTK